MINTQNGKIYQIKKILIRQSIQVIYNEILRNYLLLFNKSTILLVFSILNLRKIINNITLIIYNYFLI